MTYLVFQWARWDYEYLQRGLGPECRVLFSKDYKQRVLRYLSGSIPAVWRSKKNDTIVCWYDMQAVMCWWICHLLCLKRHIVCINILLKQKPTLKNRLVSMLYKKALTSRDFKASVTSEAYGKWLNGKLGIDVDYTLLHDVYHDYYEHPELKESEQDIVFCGGCYGRDWPLMMEIVKAMPEVKFYLVMTEVGVKDLRQHGYKKEKDYPKNVKVLVNIPYQRFMKCLCQSKVVCMPLNCESPQGLIVMFEAAANDKLILTSDTPTTEEYFDQGQRLGKDAEDWSSVIRYYLAHDNERKEKAQAFHRYLKETCGEKPFAETVKRMVESNK